uniref:NADH-ubiquinone oxidoreductase chain 5 n=1 Tax=Exallonyx sp. ZJUH_2016014 TaxID=2491158 RepID=A0A3S8V0N7_9HYME|nr:NADH dehydrogenase subunit 5 [Exallonyx sp. ZJUH_2016014]
MIMMYFSFFYMLMILGIILFFMSVLQLMFYKILFIEFNLLNFNSMEFSMILYLDYFSLMFMSVVLIISSMIFLYSSEYMMNDLFKDRFLFLMLMFILSMLLMIISPNIMSILLGWDGLGLISYCLVIYYQNFKSLKSGMVTVLSNRIGDLGLIISISMLMYMGSWNFMFYSMENYNYLLVFMIFLGSCTKSAQIPFSFWLPAAMVAPTPVSSLVHSSTLVTAGVYLMIRFYNIMIKVEFLVMILLIISMSTMLIFGISANFEFDLKKIIALSTLSQLGLMMSSLCLNFKMLAFYHLLTHAMFKSLLFMCAGVIIHLFSNFQDIRFMGGLIKVMPLLLIKFHISNLSLCGFLFLSGFYSKDKILEMSSVSSMNYILLMILYFSIGLTVSYSMRLVKFSFINSFMFMPMLNIKDVFLYSVSMLVLMILSMIGGSLLSWLLLMSLTLVYTSIFLKMFINIFLFLGIMSGVFMFKMKNLCMNFIFIKKIISMMWILGLFSMGSVKYVNYFSMEYLMLVEKGWLELMSSKNLFLLYYDLSFLQMMFKLNYMKFMLLYSISMIIILLML